MEIAYHTTLLLYHFNQFKSHGSQTQFLFWNIAEVTGHSRFLGLFLVKIPNFRAPMPFPMPQKEILEIWFSRKISRVTPCLELIEMLQYAKPLDHILWTVSVVCHPTFVDFYFFVFFMLIFHAHVFWHTTAFYTDVNYLLHTSYRPQAPSIALPSPPSLPQLHILLLQIHPSAWLIEPNEMILDLISHLWTLRISLNHPNYPNTALAHPLSLSIVLLKILAFKTLCMHHTPFRGGL